MKASKLLRAAALLTGLATLSFAGPSPQCWDQQAKNQQEQKAKVDNQAKAQPTTQVASCACFAGMKKS
jgi:hypothetical protein